jgi:hypothetical protein
MLGSRNIMATLSEVTLGASAASPHGGVLSPLLWRLVVDDLGYADDISIQINGIFPLTVSEVFQTALCTVQHWCERTKLSINPNKTLVIPLLGRRT